MSAFKNLANKANGCTQITPSFGVDVWEGLIEEAEDQVKLNHEEWFLIIAFSTNLKSYVADDLYCCTTIGGLRELIDCPSDTYCDINSTQVESIYIEDNIMKVTIFGIVNDNIKHLIESSSLVELVKCVYNASASVLSNWQSIIDTTISKVNSMSETHAVVFATESPIEGNLEDVFNSVVFNSESCIDSPLHSFTKEDINIYVILYNGIPNIGLINALEEYDGIRIIRAENVFGNV